MIMIVIVIGVSNIIVVMENIWSSPGGVRQNNVRDDVHLFLNPSVTLHNRCIICIVELISMFINFHMKLNKQNDISPLIHKDISKRVTL